MGSPDPPPPHEGYWRGGGPQMPPNADGMAAGGGGFVQPQPPRPDQSGAAFNRSMAQERAESLSPVRGRDMSLGGDRSVSTSPVRVVGKVVLPMVLHISCAVSETDR